MLRKELLKAELPVDLDLSSGTLRRLGEARKSRNELAHDFWLHALPRIMAGDRDAVLRELESARAIFEEVLADLLNTVFRRALEDRGIDEVAMNSFVTLLTATLVSSHALSGLDLLDDGDEVLLRMAGVVDRAGAHAEDRPPGFGGEIV